MDNNQKNINNNAYALNDLDFEKMNATLSNPEFANWYYNQMCNNNGDTTIDDFIKIINDYSEQKFE